MRQPLVLTSTTHGTGVAPVFGHGQDAHATWAAVILFALFAAVPSVARADPAAWFNKAWPVRRIVTVEAGKPPFVPAMRSALSKSPPTRWRPPTAAISAWPNAIGKLLPMRLLSVGPGSLARVCFAVEPGKRNYAILLRQPQARSRAGRHGPETSPRPAPGNLHVRRRDIDSYNGIVGRSSGPRRARKAPISCPASISPTISSGRRPDDQSLQRPDPDSPPTATTVSPPPATRRRPVIDGQVVVQWTGYHGAGWRRPHNKTIPIDRWPARVRVPAQ